MKQLFMLLVAALASGAATAGPDVRILEARLWSDALSASEVRGDERALLMSIRDETVMYVELEPGPGVVLKLTLRAEQLKEWLHKGLESTKGQPQRKRSCGYERDQETGTVIERCTVESTAAERAKSPGTPLLLYGVQIIAKDAKGLFTREAWVSDKRLF